MVDPGVPKEFFTAESIFTLTGATGVVYVVCGGLQRAFDFNPRWLGLAISLILAIAGTYVTQVHSVGAYLLAVINGFLIYCTAVGVNGVFAPGSGRSNETLKSRRTDGEANDQTQHRRFRTAWW